MKSFVVYYRYRGSNYRFMSPMSIRVRADNAREARQEAIMRIGDVYTIVKVVAA